MDDLGPIFTKLDEIIRLENKERTANGALLIQKGVLQLMGQMCLIMNPSVSENIHLAGTTDVDARIKAEYFVKEKMVEISPIFWSKR